MASVVFRLRALPAHLPQVHKQLTHGDLLIFFPDAPGPMGLIRDVSDGRAHVHGTIQGGGMGIEGGGGQMQDISGTRS
jgi:hypothetical protein